MADERTRYSDAELEEFKQLILKKLDNARATVGRSASTQAYTAKGAPWSGFRTPTFSARATP